MKHGIILILCLTLLLASCQPNPEQDVVVGKNEGCRNRLLRRQPARKKAEAPRTETFRHTGQGMFYDSDLSPYYTPYTFLTIHAVDGSVVDVSQGY